MTEDNKDKKKMSDAAKIGAAAIGSAALAAALLYASKHRKADHEAPKKPGKNTSPPETD